jgi:hypothetical protein
MSEVVEKPNEVGDNFRVISFAEAKQPIFKEHRSGHYTYYGEKNDYPDYLLELYRNGSKHGAIIRGKVTYVTGNGWKISGEAQDPKAAAWIARCNRYGESLAEVTKKCAMDARIFGGFYVQVIWSNLGGILAEQYHLDYTCLRSNTDNTQFYYKKDWSNYREEMKVYPAFNPNNRRGTQILYVKEYQPGIGTYALPDYLNALNYVAADIEVSKHTYSNALTGFTPSKSINLFNGEATREERRKITKRMEDAWSGAGGKKFMIWFNNPGTTPASIDDLGASDLTKEDYTAVDTLIQSNIFAGHQITTPALFGISTPGSLGESKQLRDGYEIFKNTYVNDKQRHLETWFNMLGGYAGVVSKLEIIPTDPISIELDTVTLAANMSREEIRGLYNLPVEKVVDKPASQAITEAINGMSPLVANKVLESLTTNEIRGLANLPPTPGGDNVPAPDGGVIQDPAEVDAAQFGPGTNEAVRNLTGRQQQQLMRIIRQVTKGQLTHEQGSVLLRTSLGLSDEDIATMLGTPAPGDEQQFSDDEDSTIAIFAEFGEARSHFVSLKTRKVRFEDLEPEEIVSTEGSFLKFAGERITKLQASILDLISKDKRITPEVIAEVLKSDLQSVSEAMTALVEVGAIKVGGTEETPERELTRPLKELQEGVEAKTTTYGVRYAYEGPQDSRNRPFCAKLMELDRFYSRADIERISARLGYSVWDRRGGFYHNPNTGTTTPFCRHKWVSHIVIKKS